ncbi:hypothetical protein [Oceanococcus atlanticus]|uniref:hypothetical protein n=1 Tax=Oceanococcus atlanticus TaxID=1317117 RepID=UPI0011BA4C38|nr:hypothetical protein [Oceanococcus atlanticus]
MIEVNLQRLDEFCDVWLERATAVAQPSIENIFDQFFILWVVFNRIYAESARVLAAEGHSSARMFAFSQGGKRKFAPPPDRIAATRGVEAFCGVSELNRRLYEHEESAQAIETVLSVVESGMLYLHENYETGEPDFKRDRKLVAAARNGKPSALLELLYQARCNLFHGQKAYSESQRPLLEGMVIVLRIVIDASRSKLREQYGVGA